MMLTKLFVEHKHKYFSQAVVCFTLLFNTSGIMQTIY